MSDHLLVGIILVEFSIAVAIAGGVARAIWKDERRYMLLPKFMWKKHETQLTDSPSP